jgi:hypothetical protein
LVPGHLNIDISSFLFQLKQLPKRPDRIYEACHERLCSGTSALPDVLWKEVK